MKTQSQYVFPPITSRQFPFYFDKQSYREKGETFRAHWHEHFELIFIERGTIGLVCNGVDMTAAQGDLLILNPDDVHHIHSLTDAVDYYCLVFDLSLLRTGLNDQANREVLTPLLKRELAFDNRMTITPELKACFDGLVAEQQQPDGASELMIKALLNQLLALLIRSQNYHRLTARTLTGRRNSQLLIQDILAYLERHVRDDIELATLADEFSISQHHLCHLFKRYTNHSIIQYLNRLRIEQAMEYLQHSDSSITEIAYQVGYNDANYFSRMFRKLTHSSPREWQKSVITRT